MSCCTSFWRIASREGIVSGNGNRSSEVPTQGDDIFIAPSTDGTLQSFLEIRVGRDQLLALSKALQGYCGWGGIE